MASLQKRVERIETRIQQLLDIISKLTEPIPSGLIDLGQTVGEPVEYKTFCHTHLADMKHAESNEQTVGRGVAKKLHDEFWDGYLQGLRSERDREMYIAGMGKGWNNCLALDGMTPGEVSEQIDQGVMVAAKAMDDKVAIQSLGGKL